MKLLRWWLNALNLELWVIIHFLNISYIYIHTQIYKYTRCFQKFPYIYIYIYVCVRACVCVCVCGWKHISLCFFENMKPTYWPQKLRLTYVTKIYNMNIDSKVNWIIDVKFDLHVCPLPGHRGGSRIRKGI